MHYRNKALLPKLSRAVVLDYLTETYYKVG